MKYSNTYKKSGRVGEKRRSKKQRRKFGTDQINESQARMKQGSKMAEIEAYAKANNVTIAQAMIHFMGK